MSNQYTDNLNELRKQVQKDIYELGLITNVPKEANKILRELKLSDYTHMKVHEIADLCIQLANVK